MCFSACVAQPLHEGYMSASQVFELSSYSKSSVFATFVLQQKLVILKLFFFAREQTG